MVSISRLTSLTILAVLATGLSGCLYLEDNITQYAQRNDKITLSAGNTSAANEAIHTVDPWPRASADRRIPANGERMAGAYERYRNPDKPSPRPIIFPPMTGAMGGAMGAGGAAAGGAAAAPK